MDVNVSSQDGSSVIVVSGELDLSTAAELSAAAASALSAPGVRHLDLDLSELSFIDSSGINVLIDVLNASRSAGVGLRLARCSPRVTEVMRLTATDQLFEMGG